VFASEHHDELISLVRKEESREKSEHALQRIMEIRNEADQTVITTTGIRIAHKIADAVHQAYRGSLEVKFAPDEYRVRIRWSR
jgi:aromatic ring-opening dioxygenase LigB subunit